MTTALDYTPDPAMSYWPTPHQTCRVVAYQADGDDREEKR